MFPSITGSIFGVTASPRVLPSTTPLVTVEGEAYATYRLVPFPMTLNDPLIHISKSRQYSTLNMSSTLKLKTHNYLGLQWLLYTSARPVSTGQLQRSRRLLDTESAATLVNLFVASRIDYCNAVLAGAPKATTNKLQRVLNAAARVVSGTHKFDRARLVATPYIIIVRTLRNCANQSQVSHPPPDST